MLQTVVAALGRRVGQGIMSGKMSDQSSAVARLFGGVTTARRINIGYDLAGAAGGAWSDYDGAAGGLGSDFLLPQVSSIGRRTTEIARNVLTERVLGMPPQPAPPLARPPPPLPPPPTPHGP